MAYKVFANGYPLLASELNNYLMNQSVISFTSATERDSTLTSPIEGQLVWLQDLNKYVSYNGSAWVDLVNIPDPGITEQTGTSYTIDADDAQTTIMINNASGTTVTIADVLSAGQRIDFVQKGAGAITFAADSGVTLNSPGGLLSTAEQYVGVTVICEASNTYYLVGNLA